MAFNCSFGPLGGLVAFILSALATVIVDASTESQSGTPRNPYAVPRAVSEVQVDGVLDEPAWQKALTLELAWEVSPRQNVPPPVRTEVLLAYSETHFLVGFRAYDPDPSSIRAYLSERDSISSDDWVAVELDTYNDQRRTFTLIVNPLGVQTDGLGDARGAKDYSWDMIFESAGTLTDWGFSVEIGIPFSSLRFQRTQGPQVWGINTVRGYPRSVSHQIWNAPYDRSNTCRVCQYVKIEGFEGVSPGRNLEINPTLTAMASSTREPFPEGPLPDPAGQVDVGLTGRWGITPNMVASGTVNPDYSHIEADAAQLDINQPFALFYPEKRPFFNEGSEIFKTPLQAVYTRTMRNPNWGAKLTGKEAGNALGAYFVDDDVTQLIFPGSQSSRSTLLESGNRAAVFRYNRDLWNNSNLGVLVTDREGEEYFNRVLGVDGLFRLTKSDQVSFQFLGSSTRYTEEVASSFGQPGGTFGDSAFLVDFKHFTRHFQGELNYGRYGEDFRADLGFIPQVGFQGVGGSSQYLWIAEEPGWWTSFLLKGDFQHFTETDGTPLEKGFRSSLTYKGPWNSSFSGGLSASREWYLGSAFELVRFSLDGELWPTKNLIVLFQSSQGDRIDFANVRRGYSRLFSPSLFLRAGKHAQLDFSHVLEKMEAAGDRLYTANISQATLSYHFTSRTSVRALLQYINYDYNVSNTVAPVSPRYEQFFTQLRFSYRLNPRTVLFIGCTDNQLGDTRYGLTRKDYTLFAKLGYAWVF